MSDPPSRHRDPADSTLVDFDTGASQPAAGPETTLVEEDAAEPMTEAVDLPTGPVQVRVGPLPPDPLTAPTTVPILVPEEATPARRAPRTPTRGPMRSPPGAREPEGKRVTREAIPQVPIEELSTRIRPAPMPSQTAPGDDGDSGVDTSPTNQLPSSARRASKRAAPPAPAADAGVLRAGRWVLAFLGAVCLGLFAWWIIPGGGEPASAEVSPAQPIARPEPPPGQSAPPKPAVASAPRTAEEVATNVLGIEELVDAGAGYVKPLPRPACLVRFTSEPEAEVSIDGGVLGTTPFIITLPVGPVTATFVNKKLGLHKQVVVDVPALPQVGRTFAFRRGWLELDVPAGSAVAIDGRTVSFVPDTPIELFEGQHQIEVRLPNGKRHSGSVHVSAHQTVSHYLANPSPAE